MVTLRYRVIAGLLLGLTISSQAAEPPAFSIADFGAKGDGKTLNTTAIANAIDAAVQAGGGVVKIPGGKWVSGAIELKSNVTLFLDNSATLIMSSEPADYPVIFTRWEGVECYNYSGLIYANNADHIAIKGHGMIDGQGPNWWRWAKSEGPARRMLWSLGEAVNNPKDRLFGTIRDSLRPNLIEFTHCEDVLIEGVTLKNAPLVAIHPLYSERVTCRDLYIFSQGPLTDGIDPDSCKKVLIDDCTIDSGGDCIAIKSGRDFDGRRVNIPCQEITIQNCHMQRGRSGVAIGSEMAGGVSNVNINHCGMRGTDRGIYIKTMRGRGGVVENLRASDLKFIDLQGPGIIIDMQYNPSNPKPADDTTPRIRNISFRNVNCLGAQQAMILRGLPEAPIEGLTLSNAKMKAEFGIDAQLVTQTQFDHVELNLSKPDPALKAEQIGDVMIDTFKSARSHPTEPMLTLMSCAGVTIKNATAPAGTDVFLQVSGADTKEIELVDCDTLKAKQRLDIDGDVRENAVKD